MTPLHILIGIHYYATPGVYSEFNATHANSDAVLKCTQDLENAGLLVHRAPTPENTARYEGTEGLRMWIAALTKVPLPQLAWTMPQTMGETPLPGDRFRGQAYGTDKQWGAAIDDMDCRVAAEIRREAVRLAALNDLDGPDKQEDRVAHHGDSY